MTDLVTSEAARALADVLKRAADSLGSDELEVLSDAMVQIRSAARGLAQSLAARGWGGGALDGFGESGRAEDLAFGTTAAVSWPEAVTYTTCFYSHLLHESRFRTEKAFHSRQVDRFIGESQDAHTQARRAYQSLHGVPSLFRADVVTGKGR